MQKIFFQNPFFKKQKNKKNHETILTQIQITNKIQNTNTKHVGQFR